MNSKNYELALQKEPVEFFSLSLKRLTLFNILTLGLYQIYWFYKNWKAIKKAENSKIIPLGRAIISVIFCYSLFKKVLLSAKSLDYQKSYSPGWLAAIYIILTILGNAFMRLTTKTDQITAGLDVFFSIIFILLSLIPIVFVQKAINFNNEKTNGKSALNRKLSRGEIIMVAIGAIFFLAVFLSPFVPRP